MNKTSKKVVDIALARTMSDKFTKNRRNEKIKQVLFFFVVLCLGGMIVYFHEPNINKPLLNAQDPLLEVNDQGDKRVSLMPDLRGHYVFVGKINEKGVKFVYDTGASLVVIPEGVANYLDLDRGKMVYAQTANGLSVSYQTILKRVNVGGIELRNVEGSIATGFDGDKILLGMSFLKQVDILQRNGELELTRRSGT